MLEEIIKRLESGESSADDMARIFTLLHPECTVTGDGLGGLVNQYGGRFWAPDYRTSLDAALTLVPEGWRLYDLHESDDRTQAHCHAERVSDRRLVESGLVATPALALCIAALKARIAP